MTQSTNPTIKTVDLAIIGAGTAGINAYKQARKHTDSILVINSGYWTTTCATVGCMPSKLLIAAAERAHHANHSDEFGVEGTANINDKQVMKRVQTERDRFTGSVQKSVDSWDDTHKISGYAKINAEGNIEVFTDTQSVESALPVMSVEAKYIIIATGSTPFIPKGWADKLGETMLTSDTVFEMADLPKSLAVVGAGAIGLELAQAMHRLGVDVTLFNRVQRVGGIQDDKVNRQAIACLSNELTMQLDAAIEKVDYAQGKAIIEYITDNGDIKTWQGDKVLVATGRRANLGNLDLQHLGVNLDENGQPKHHDIVTGQVADLPVFVVGDANAHLPLLHVASNEGYRAGQAVANLLAGKPAGEGLSDPNTMMGVVFCEPQIASVGKSLPELEDLGLDYVVGEVSFESQGRSRVMGVNCGLLRIYAEKCSGKILGASMVAPDAEYIAHILATAITHNLTTNDLLASPFYHPTILEGLRTALRDVGSKIPQPCTENSVNQS